MLLGLCAGACPLEQCNPIPEQGDLFLLLLQLYPLFFDLFVGNPLQCPISFATL